MCGPRKLDRNLFGKVLMKLGLGLIVSGHLNFITGAIVHGLVLKHVAKLQDILSLQYSISNIITVASAILSISCGISAIVLSRYLARVSLRWAVLLLSIINAILSITCTLGLAVSVIITIANKGRTLLASCTFTNLELIQISHECPFDPTRIYSTTLILWAISIFWDIVEIVFSMRCFITVLHLMKVRMCRKRKEKLQLPRIEEVNEENEDGECSAWL
ncbi:transmembrane protein 54 isoform X2 [Bombina bombina]|uniref:transmembrane protein 54 isoform X2 n=1 Tax=Bombina bombina TaxID=8345 RepID=UPI00235A9208|nr:transmembrane protein 54 isoform X2 [Bombina bombina]